MKNIFTIDLEDYYHCNFKDETFKENLHVTPTIEKNTEKILNIFDKYNVKATFFVLGKVAELYPNIVKKIHNKGHEISSHGYAHKLIYTQTKEEFRNDIKKSKMIIENIIGEPVIGYRAPSWSIREDNKYALEIIEEEGFKYSSSIFPTQNFLYGIKNAPIYTNNPEIGNNRLKLIEIPPSTVKIVGKRIGFSGGFYFRFFPLFIIKRYINKLNKLEQPAICYLHPWEIDSNTPKLNVPFIEQVIHQYGTKRCYRKLEKLLKSYKFTSIKDYYKNKIQND